MNNMERELKIALTEKEYNLLLNLSDKLPQLQTNYYFYFDGMPESVMLRLRKKADKYVFGYKKLLSSADGVNLCDERETEVGEAEAQAMIQNGVSAEQVKSLVNADTAERCLCVGKLDTYRAKFVWESRTLELDKNEYLGVVDYEVECECDAERQLTLLKERLLSELGIAFKPSLSKSNRFFKRYLYNI